MAVGYQLVLWNDNKKRYDLALALGAVGFIATYILVSAVTAAPGQDFSPLILVIRALGLCTFGMLTIILAIGPLARLNPSFLPLLYNRRHFGVTTFMLGLFHFILALVWYHGFGAINPLVSVFASSASYDSLTSLPFEVFGFAALVILFVMAATSHDFWLANLSAPVWKALHMAVYIAYGSLCLHIAFGILQDETAQWYWVLLGGSVLTVGGLHLLAGMREVARDSVEAARGTAWHEVGPVGSIPLNRARIVPVAGGDSIAVFRYGDKISAVANACAHQNGPLGEGRIVDGCITCPWHGYQYRPEDGQSPPPFTEKIATYRVKVENDTVYVDPEGLPPGTPVAPAPVTSGPVSPALVSPALVSPDLVSSGTSAGEGDMR